MQDFFLSSPQEKIKSTMSLRGDVCVVTGACGFLGKRLVRLLLEEEKMAEIRLLDKHIPPQHVQTLEGINLTKFTHHCFSITCQKD